MSMLSICNKRIEPGLSVCIPRSSHCQTRQGSLHRSECWPQFAGALQQLWLQQTGKKAPQLPALLLLQPDVYCSSPSCQKSLLQDLLVD